MNFETAQIVRGIASAAKMVAITIRPITDISVKTAQTTINNQSGLERSSSKIPSPRCLAA